MGRRIGLVVCAGAILTLAGAGCVAAQPQGAVQAAPPYGPPAEPPPPGSGGVPDGEWVYTQQYGWVWMTYGDAYAYLPPDGFGEPLEYVYYPSYGWVWISAPWVWGIGPWPHFARGPKHFAWYSHGYWRHPSRWRYRPAPERGGVASGIRPAPIRPAPRQRRPERAGGEERRGGRDGDGRERGAGDGGRGDGGDREGVAPAPRR